MSAQAKQWLYALGSVRLAVAAALALSVFTGVFVPPLWASALAMIALDSLDCFVPRTLGLYDSYSGGNFCKTDLYQTTDKLVDTLSYALLLACVWRTPGIPHRHRVALSALLAFRVVGVLCYFATNNRHALLWTPNFFLEGSLLVGLSAAVSPVFTSAPVVAGAALAKVAQEIYLHGRRGPGAGGRGFRFFL